ncbi:MAG: hypothetical protein ACPGVU_06230 [Limisphaerales bacterium]
MRIALAIGLLAVVANAADSPLAATWMRTNLPVAEHDAMVEQGKKMSFTEIGPVLLDVMVKHRPLFGHYNHSGDKPWNSDLLEGGHRNYVMAEIVWAHHMRQPNDPARAEVLLQLFPKNIQRSHARFWLVDSMTHDHWIPKMEAVLTPLLDDTSIELGSRHTILNAMTTRVDLNKHLPRVIRFVREEKDWYERARTYNRLTNFGNRFFTLTEANQTALLDLGFDVLESVPKARLHNGYFVARRLGFFAKAKNTFAPDQSDPKYQGDGKLKDSFFADTVRNALEWRREMKPPLTSRPVTGKFISF